MVEVSKGYETFIKGKELNNQSKKLFDIAIKKSVKPIKKTKPRGLK